MKLLLDQNISFRISKKIQDIFPDSKQVKDLGLENSKDPHQKEYGLELAIPARTILKKFFVRILN